MAALVFKMGALLLKQVRRPTNIHGVEPAAMRYTWASTHCILGPRHYPGQGQGSCVTRGQHPHLLSQEPDCTSTSTTATPPYPYHHIPCPWQPHHPDSSRWDVLGCRETKVA